MRIAIYPHNMGSHGASRLRDVFIEMGHRAKLVRENGRFDARRFSGRDLILGWGNTTLPNWVGTVPGTVRWLNKPQAIALAVDKLQTLAKLAEQEVATPEFTTSADTARGWLGDGKTVIGRRLLRAARGEGIVVMNSTDQFVQCPLYTKWKSADREYRVYVLNDQVVDYLQKRRPNGATDLGIIRSAANGWVYCRTDIKELPQSAGEMCVKAVRALGLSFGGVDILWGNKTGPRVLEVNTSPGIEGEGVRKIAQAFVQQYGGYNAL